MYKSIVFDLGGVMIDFDPRGYLVDRLCNAETEEEVYDLTFGSEEWKLLDAGLVSRFDGNHRMLEKARAAGRAFEVQGVLDDWLHILRPRRRMQELVRRLKNHGYSVYYLSNIPEDVLALLNSYMVQKYNQPAIDEKGRKFSYSKAQWADFFGMYKKLIDNHVMPDTRYYASFGKSNMYEMKPWIQGEWGGTYMWNSTINKYSDNLKPPAKLVLGEYPMLPGATDAGLFFKPAQMLSIGKSTKNPQAAAKVINFLLNSKEGVDILGLERGVPLSKAAVTYLTEDGVIKADDPAVSGLKLAQSLPTTLPVSPYFDDPQIVAQFGTTLQYIDYGKKSVEEAAEDFQRQTDRILRRVMR